MKFEEWFYQDNVDSCQGVRKPVNEFDDVLADLHATMESYMRVAYEAGYKQGVKDRE